MPFGSLLSLDLHDYSLLLGFLYALSNDIQKTEAVGEPHP